MPAFGADGIAGDRLDGVHTPHMDEVHLQTSLLPDHLHTAPPVLGLDLRPHAIQRAIGLQPQGNRPRLIGVPRKAGGSFHMLGRIQFHGTAANAGHVLDAGPNCAGDVERVIEIEMCQRLLRQRLERGQDGAFFGRDLLPQRRHQRLCGLFGRLSGGGEAQQLAGLRLRWHLDHGGRIILGDEAGIHGAVEECKELVEFFLGERIVLVIVALRAAHGDAHPRRGSGVEAVHHVLGAVFLINDATFIVGHVVALETGGHQLIARGVRQQIARQLFDGELVKRQVVVERFNNPVAPKPGLARVIAEVAIGIGIAGHVQPVDGHAFAEVGALEKAIRRSLDGGREEGSYFFRGGRQTREIK